MKPFLRQELAPQNTMQKMLKILPAENALRELNNLLFSSGFDDFRIQQIEEINKKYKLDVRAKFKKETAKLLEDFVEYHLNQELPNDGSRYIPKLIEILGIESKKADEILAEIKAKVYRNRFELAVVNRRLSEEEETILDTLRVNLGLDEKTAEEISQKVRGNAIQSYVNRMIEDGEVSPQEEEELNQAAKSLAINVEMSEESRLALEKLRLVWRINHEELQTIEPDIILQKKELCYYMQKVDWYEHRAVKSSVGYGGLSGRIKIAKGIYYRVGKMGLNVHSTQEMTKIDTGKVYITNKRLIFAGGLKNTSIPFSKIINLQPYKDGIEIIKDSGKSPLLAFSNDVDIFTATLTRAISDSL